MRMPRRDYLGELEMAEVPLERADPSYGCRIEVAACELSHWEAESRLGVRARGVFSFPEKVNLNHRKFWVLKQVVFNYPFQEVVTRILIDYFINNLVFMVVLMDPTISVR